MKRAANQQMAVAKRNTDETVAVAKRDVDVVIRTVIAMLEDKHVKMGQLGVVTGKVGARVLVL